jgi:hypothetical protein
MPNPEQPRESGRQPHDTIIDPLRPVSTVGPVTKPGSSPFRVGSLPAEVRLAAVSTVAVLLLVLLPIRTYAPGDAESKLSCGNALSLDLRPWAGPSDGDYLTPAFLHCTDERGDRLAGAALIMTLTILILAATASRRPQPE